MTCESWMKKFDRYLDHELQDAEMEEFHTHLKSCDHCKTQYDLHMEMEESLKDPALSSPEQGFTRRVMAKIEGDPLFGVERASNYTEDRASNDTVERAPSFAADDKILNRSSRRNRKSIGETLRLTGYIFIAFLFILSIRNLFFGNVEWLSGLYITGRVLGGLLGGSVFSSFLTYTLMLPGTVLAVVREQLGPLTPQGIFLYTIVLTNLILFVGATQVFLRRLVHSSTTGNTKGGREE